MAALEFVLVAPLLVALLFGVYDLSEALIFYQEVYAQGIPLRPRSATWPYSPDGTTELSYSQVQEAEVRNVGANPFPSQWLSGWNKVDHYIVDRV